MGEKQKKQSKIDAWQAELTIPASDLEAILRSLRHSRGDILIERIADGLIARTVDPSHVTMARARIQTALGIATLPVGQGVALTDPEKLVMLLADIGPREPVTLRFGSKKPKELEFSADGRSSTMECIPPEQTKAFRFLTEIKQLTCRIYLPAGDVLAVARAESKHADRIDVALLQNGGVRFSAESEVGVYCQTLFPRVWEGKLGSVLYPLDVFTDIFQAVVAAAGSGATVTFESGDDSPLRVEADMPYGEVTYLLAPRVEDDKEPESAKEGM